MPYNSGSSRVFRYCFLTIYFAFVFAAVLLGRLTDFADPAIASTHTKIGIDVLEEQKFAPLVGKRVGLITNQTGVDSAGRRTIDVLAQAPGVKLVALFSPEHGIAGKLDDKVENASDAATGLPIYSLYGESRRPTAEMFANLDAIVYDIQDAGVRFYTYVTTMGYCMEQAANQHIAFFVLDRPDILGGEVVEGPMLDADKTSFVAYFPMPVRFGMTLGELAQMFNSENKIGADLHVVAMRNWRRDELYDETGLSWIPPSPNLRTLRAAFLYPGIEILQAGGVSVARGTGTPFELLGAPWINADELVAGLQKRRIPGLKIAPAEFTPTAALYKGEKCGGVALTVTDRRAFRSMLMGLEIIAALHKLYPQNFDVTKTMELLGSQSTVDALERGVEPRAIVAGWSSDLQRFRAMRQKYLIYR